MRANCILMILFVLLTSCSKEEEEEEERSRIDDGYIKFTFNNQNYEYNRKLNAEMNYVRTNISGYHNDESHVIQFTVPFIEANKILSSAPDTINPKNSPQNDKDRYKTLLINLLTFCNPFVY